MYPEFRIEQKIGFFEKNIVHLFSNNEIEISYKALFKSQSARISLDLINPNPVIFKKFNIKAFFMFVLCLLVSVASLFSYFQGSVSKNDFPVVLGVVFFLFSLLALNSCIKSSVTATIFLHKATGSNLFALFPSKTERLEFDGFVSALIQRINSIRYPNDLGPEQKTEIYTKHIEYLLHEGVITNQEFTAILSRLGQVKKSADIIKLV